MQRYVIPQAIRHGVAYPKQLSAQLGIIPTQLSRSLDVLHSQDLIGRRLDAQDSRRTRLTVTSAGHDVTQRASHAIHQTLALRLRALGPERLAATLTAIDLLASLDQPESP